MALVNSRFSRAISLLISVWILCGILQVPIQAAIKYEVIDLGTLGGDISWANSINNSGQVVGESYYREGYRRAILFDPNGSGNNIDLGTLGGQSSRANSINEAGQIVGESQNSQGDWRATLFDSTGSGNNIDLGTLGGNSSSANSINDIGQIVGVARYGTEWWDSHATLFDPTGAGNNIDLGTLPTTEDCSSANSINNDGKIVGMSGYGWTQGRATLFDPTGQGNNIDLGTVNDGVVNSAKSINNIGQIVGFVWYDRFNSNAVMFDPTGDGDNIDLGKLGGIHSIAHSINDTGLIVGSAEDYRLGGHAILFDPTDSGNNIELESLIDPDSGWTLESANDISNSGWIVGQGINPERKSHAFLLVPILPRYSGGTGDPNDPYQIATVEDLILLGESPDDYDKHFILTSDIDLDPNLSGRKVFDKAVIAPDTNDVTRDFQGIPFAGSLDGNGHTISNLMIVGHGYLGLFGHLAEAHIKQIGIVDVNIRGSGDYVGGLVGGNGDFYGSGMITQCYSSGTIAGHGNVGGLVGYNYDGNVINCYSMCTVYGDSLGSPYFGGCGGLVGWNVGEVINCYSIGTVNGGGLIGNNAQGGWGGIKYGMVVASFWDVDNSGQLSSAGGEGKATNQMLSQNTYIGWEGCDGEFTWTINEGKDYPRLYWEKKTGEGITATPLSEFMLGQGTAEDPYLVQTMEDLSIIGTSYCYWNKHFKLMVDIDMSDLAIKEYSIIGYTKRFTVLEYELGDWHESYHYYKKPFTGVFDGNGHTISNFDYTSTSIDSLGFFGYVDDFNAEIKNLGLIDPNVNSPTGHYVGTLVGVLRNGTITNCYVEGGNVLGYESVGGLVGRNGGLLKNVEYPPNGGDRIVDCHVKQIHVFGDISVGGLVGDNSGIIVGCRSTGIVDSVRGFSGGLVGQNDGNISNCFSSSAVGGHNLVGGLVGFNSDGTITASFATGDVLGYSSVGGLVGHNRWEISNCYSTGIVSGNRYVGGLVGSNRWSVTTSYSSNSVSGEQRVGGLVGSHEHGEITNSFWDLQVSDQVESDGGTGKATAEMQTASTFLEAGWDFIGETANGTDDIWWIDEGKDYPRLWWEAAEQ